MSSFTLFGICFDGLQTRPYDANKDNLTDVMDKLLNVEFIEKVVVMKNWVIR